MAWSCKYTVDSKMVMAKQSNDNLSLLVWEAMEKPCLFSRHLCLMWWRPHEGFLKRCRVVSSPLHRCVPEHGRTCCFSFSSTLNLVLSLSKCAPQGSHFLCFMWDSLMVYPVFWYPQPLHTRILPVELTLGGSCTLCCLSQFPNHLLILWLLTSLRIRSNERFSQWRSCAAINISRYQFLCQSMRLKLISQPQELLSVPVTDQINHRSKGDNWINAKDLHLWINSTMTSRHHVWPRGN